MTDNNHHHHKNNKNSELHLFNKASFPTETMAHPTGLNSLGQGASQKVIIYDIGGLKDRQGLLGKQSAFADLVARCVSTMFSLNENAVNWQCMSASIGIPRN
jgi:hypothetical protein